MKIEWNIDPFNKGEHATGDVQIWADVSEEDAQFIVRAINSHEELIGKIRFCLTLLQENVTTPLEVEVMETLEKAIAKAEGK